MCLPERALAFSLREHAPIVRCADDAGGVSFPGVGGMVEASSGKDVWLVRTSTAYYKVPDVSHVRSFANGVIPEDAVRIEIEPDVGP